MSMGEIVTEEWGKAATCPRGAKPATCPRGAQAMMLFERFERVERALLSVGVEGLERTFSKKI